MIVRFKTKRHFYVYDVSTNSLFQVSRPVFELIENRTYSSTVGLFGNWKNGYSAKEIEDASDSIKSMLKLGYFLERPNVSFGLPFTKEEVKANLDTNLINLILEVTQQCNLRCAYCPYSGMANGLRRHNMTQMTFDIAKKAIDYYFCHSSDTSKRVISFYGGEPLLNIGLIERCVDYTKALDGSAQFAITTNGVLLDDRIISFLEEHSFIVTLSMDGPKAFHDHFRIDASGRGSFDKCHENFKKIYSAFSNPRRINVNISIGTGEYLEAQYRFFSEFSREYECNLNPTSLSFDEGNKGARVLRRQFYSKKTYLEMHKLRSRYLRLLLNGASPSYLGKIFGKELRFIHLRKQVLASKYLLRPNGICIPGWEKLFVDVNGNFYICEKMTDFGNIGDISRGLNYRRINEMLEEYIDFCNKDCISCWCMHLCRACFINAKDRGKMRIEARRRFCSRFRKYMNREVSTYLKIIEEKPRAFDFLGNEQQVDYFKERLQKIKEGQGRAMDSQNQQAPYAADFDDEAITRGVREC